MRLGIYAPYRRCETTQLALRLADESSFCSSVTYLASGLRGTGVDHYWDNRVRSARRLRLRDWARTVDHIVWFEEVPSEFERIRRDRPKFPQTLVPDWRKLTRETVKRFNRYTHVFFPCRQPFQELNGRGLIFTQPNVEFLAMPWPAGLSPRTRSGPRLPRRLSVFFNGDGHAVDSLGPLLLYTLARILLLRKTLTVTLACEKSWPAPLLSRIKELQRDYPENFRPEFGITRQQRWVLLSQHDWYVDLSLSSSSALGVTEALLCGLPVISFDRPPVSSYLSIKSNAILIPCQLHCEDIRAPAAVPDAQAILDALTYAITDKRRLEDLQGSGLARGLILDDLQEFRRHWRICCGEPADAL